MTRPAPARPEREQSTGEEIANAITHGVGAVLSLACLSVAVVFAALRNNAWCVTSMSVYGATMFLMYLSSTLYHALVPPRAKAVFNIFDHNAIYLMIAGSYTPFCLVPMREYSPGWGWAIFGVIWGLTVGGIVFQSCCINKFRKLSTALYVAMGWIILIAAYPLWKAFEVTRHCGTLAVSLLALGGMLYTAGVFFYLKKERRYMHSVWHIFIILGALTHYFELLFLVVLRPYVP